MQETKFPFEDAFKTKQEFFVADDEKELTGKMDKRLKQLEAEGHELLRRVPIPQKQAARIAKKLSNNGDNSFARDLAKALRERR